MTATPSVAPTCRLVDATAAATPACAGGIPETAVLVIGGLIEAEPDPEDHVGRRTATRAACRRVSPVSSSGADDQREPPPTAAAAAAPRQPPAAGERRETSSIAASGSVHSPACSGESRADLLQVERVEEQESAERGERADARWRSRRERGAAEEAHLDQRLGAAQLVARRGRRTRSDRDREQASGSSPRSSRCSGPR